MNRRSKGECERTSLRRFQGATLEEGWFGPASRVARASFIQFLSGSHSSADLQSIHAWKHNALAVARTSSSVAMVPSYITLRRRRILMGSRSARVIAGAATTVLGYRHASLYRIDHLHDKVAISINRR